jgi:ubiquinone/menaquinone biosynthesis C-methylase UbiE
MKLNEAHVRYSAEEYDRYTAKFVRPFDEALADRVIEEVEKRPGASRLVDVGAGTARLLLYLATLPRLDQLTFIGTDLFEDMVQQGRKAIADVNLANRVRMVTTDVHAMELPDECADIIISRSTLHHWSDPVRALREIDRLLKPGGVAIIHDVRRDPSPEALAEFNRLRAMAGIGPAFLDEKFTTGEVRDLLDRAGLGTRALLGAPTEGLWALGMEVEIHKPVRDVLSSSAM